MKKTIAFLSACALLFGLTACGTAAELPAVEPVGTATSVVCTSDPTTSESPAEPVGADRPHDNSAEPTEPAAPAGADTIRPQQNQPSPTQNQNPFGITLQVMPSTVGPTRASFILYNPSEHEFIFGEGIGLQRLVNGAWQRVPYASGEDTLLVPLIGYTLHPGETQVLTESWEHSHGALPPGNYRLVRSFTEWVQGDNRNIGEASVTLYTPFEVIAGQTPGYAFMDFARTQLMASFITGPQLAAANIQNITPQALENALPIIEAVPRW